MLYFIVNKNSIFNNHINYIGLLFDNYKNIELIKVTKNKFHKIKEHNFKEILIDLKIDII